MGVAFLRVLDFNGLSMTGTEYEGCFLTDFDIAAQFPLEAVMAEAVDDFPSFIRGDPQDRVIPLHVIVRNPTQTLIDGLKTVFSPFGDPAYLRVMDDSGNARRMEVKSLGLTPWKGHDEESYVASLEAPEPIWEADTLASGTATISASPTSWGLTPGGNERSWPTVEISVNAVKGNANHWRRRWPITIAWRSPLPGVDSLGGPYPIDIVNALLNSTAEIAGGRLLASGNDLRVLVDGVEVDRWLGSWDTATSRVWCNIAFQPRRRANVAVAMTAGSPGSGGTLTVSNAEGTAEFPERGILLIESEAITYNGKTADSFLDLRRGQRGTTAASHGAGTAIYWVEHDIQIVTDYTGAGTPPSSQDEQPMIDLDNSTNARWLYNQQAGLVAPDTLRSGQWLRELRSEALFAPYHRLYPTGAGVYPTLVEDALPEAGRPNFDSVSCYTPCYANGTGTPTGTAAALQLDYLVDHGMLMEIIAADDEGFETSVVRRDIRGPSAADFFVGVAPVHADQTFTLDNASRVTLHGRNQAHTGQHSIATNFVVGPLNTMQAESFPLNDEVLLDGVWINIIKSAGCDRDLIVAVYSFDPGTGPGAGLVESKTVPTASIPDSGPDDDNACSIFFNRPVRLPTGQYAIVFSRSAGSVGTVRVHGRTSPIYVGGERWEQLPAWTEFPSDDIGIIVFGENAINQADAPYGTGRTVEWSDVRLAFNASFTPSVVRGTQQDIYWFDALFENLTTGQQFTINALMPVASSMLVIDAGAHTAVVRVTGAHDVSVLESVEPSDGARWLYILPGAQTFRWTEASLGAATVTVRELYRRRWT